MQNPDITDPNHAGVGRALRHAETNSMYIDDRNLIKLMKEFYFRRLND
jgi:hypothetical protein